MSNYISYNNLNTEIMRDPKEREGGTNGGGSGHVEPSGRKASPVKVIAAIVFAAVLALVLYAALT